MSCLFTVSKRPTIKDLCKYVLPLYAARWKKIGIFLGIQLEQLNVIKLDNPGDTNGCCIDLFGKWLEGTDNVTWEKMFDAIDLVIMSVPLDNATNPITASK